MYDMNCVCVYVHMYITMYACMLYVCMYGTAQT